MNIPFFRPSIGAEERAAVDAVLASGWLTTGQVTRQFESRFAEYLGVPHAIAVNSCTAALHLAAEACGVGRDDVVLVPAMTFAATAEVVRYLGGRPVLVDCEARTLCVDPDAMEQAARHWSQRGPIKAMIPVHYGGQMADMDRLTAIARRHGMKVIEDGAHTLPAYTRSSPADPWRAVGTTSPLTCFSFYANKCITTGEGGIVTADDSALAERMRMMSLHGLSKDAWNRFATKGYWYYEILEPGFKYNLTDLAGALGLEQLAKADRFWQERRAVAAHYAARLSAYAEWLELYPELENRRSSWHLYPVKLRLEELAIDRAAFIEALKSGGITCSVHWMPLHLHPYYRDTYGYKAADCPVAAREWLRLISLPIFPGMTESETDYVCDAIIALVEQHRMSPAQVAVCA